MSKVINMGKLQMVRDGRLIEGHPVGLDKIIIGDVRERSWVSEGQTYNSQNTDGTVLFDRAEIIEHRPWFILVYESGKRYIGQAKRRYLIHC